MYIQKRIRRMLCCALDIPDARRACSLIDELAPFVGIFKIGLIVKEMPEYHVIREYIQKRGCKVFVDSKYFDIPYQVGGAVARLNAYGVHYCTVSMEGTQSVERLKAAVERKGAVKILAVTVLTSEDRGKAQGMPTHTSVLYRTVDALSARADGIVCSGQDLQRLYEVSADFSPLIKCMPGIRPYGSPPDDQKMVVSPREAVLRSHAYNAREQIMLVCGRPLTHEKYNGGSPEIGARRLHTEIAGALNEVRNARKAPTDDCST